MIEADKALRCHLNCLDNEREKNLTPGHDIRPSSIHPDCQFGKKVHEAHDEFLDAKKAAGEALTYKHYVDKLLPFYERFEGRVVAALSEADGIAYKSYLMNHRSGRRARCC